MRAIFCLAPFLSPSSLFANNFAARAPSISAAARIIHPHIYLCCIWRLLLTPPARFGFYAYARARAGANAPTAALGEHCGCARFAFAVPRTHAAALAFAGAFRARCAAAHFAARAFCLLLLHMLLRCILRRFACARTLYVLPRARLYAPQQRAAAFAHSALSRHFAALCCTRIRTRSFYAFLRTLRMLYLQHAWRAGGTRA